VRSIVVISAASELGVQILATKIPDNDLVADKMSADDSLDHSGDITCQLVVPIPRDHRAWFACDRRKKRLYGKVIHNKDMEKLLADVNRLGEWAFENETTINLTKIIHCVI
jgi:hypothetical protein